MLIVRDVFQAKYGRGDELVALFREMKEMNAESAGMRVMTDASGAFFRVVTEMEVESFAQWTTFGEAEMANADFGPWFRRMMEVTESGFREFFTIVE